MEAEAPPTPAKAPPATRSLTATGHAGKTRVTLQTHEAPERHRAGPARPGHPGARVRGLPGTGQGPPAAGAEREARASAADGQRGQGPCPHTPQAPDAETAGAGAAYRSCGHGWSTC